MARIFAVWFFEQLDQRRVIFGEAGIA